MRKFDINNNIKSSLKSSPNPKATATAFLLCYNYFWLEVKSCSHKKCSQIHVLYENVD